MLTLALSGPKGQKTGIPSEWFGVPSRPAGGSEIIIMKAVWQ